MLSPLHKLLAAFCLLINLANHNTANAQSYLNYTSTWTESSGSCGFSGTCDYLDYTRILTGDTIINGKTYYKVFTSGTLSIYDLSLGAVVSVEPYIAPIRYIREEQKRFIEYRTYNDNERIFADFDLTVGDTAVNISCQSPLIVDHIDTVYLNAEPRRRFYFRPGGASGVNKTLIEGVGSSAGLFTSPCHEIGIESGSSMDCFSQENGLIVLDTSAECNSTGSIKLSVLLQSGIQVFPNPAVDYVDVVLTNQVLPGPYKINLYNLQGKLLSSDVVPFQEDRSRIDLSFLSPGVYLLFVYDGSQIETYKIIKGK